MKINIKNERVKRNFFRRLKEADGNCESTVTSVEKAILFYEDFTKAEDFALFNPDKAVKFKEWLKQREYKGRPIALATLSAHLRHLQKFFKWLSQESGYKSKVKINAVDFLRLSEKEERIAAQSCPRLYPPLDHVIKLVQAIKVETEVDSRDRALIAFTLLSGMRDQAIATLPIGCFNEETLIVLQNPRQGVQTKFSKHIQTSLIIFDKELLAFVLDWMKYLKGKGFGSNDPLFPRTKLEQGEDNLSFSVGREVEAVYWKGAGRIREIFKSRAAEAGLPYFPPHCFRHLAVDLALKSCQTGEQVKAISQNFGHEHIATTLQNYANFTPDRLASVMNEMNFTGKPKQTTDEKLEELKKLILAR